MEIKINKEIRSYKETVYFGLTARQLICSLLAVGTAVGLYFALRGVLDRETLGWLCIVGVAPMAVAGFFHYGVTKLDGIVEKIIRHQFAQIKMASQDDVIAQQHEKAVKLARARCNMAEMQLSEKRRELEDYQKEIIKVIRGENRLSADLLNELINKAQADVETLSQTAEAARQELESRIADMETEQQAYDKLKTWADLYDNCNFAAKKMIVSQFIKFVRIYRDYTLEVEFNVSFEQFQQLQAACSGGVNERTNVCIEA